MITNILLLLAVTFFGAAIIVGSDFIKVKGEWKSVVVTYGLLAVGVLLFGIVLTL